MSKTNITADGLRLLKNNVLVSNLDHGVKLTRGGIILPDDNMRESGVRDRWAKVFAVGPEVDDLVPGNWVLIKHGRWTNGMSITIDGDETTVWRIEYPESVLVMSEEDPRTTTDKTL
jgi:co-chaperonin GroES (HSP10)